MSGKVKRQKGAGRGVVVHVAAEDRNGATRSAKERNIQKLQVEQLQNKVTQLLQAEPEAAKKAALILMRWIEESNQKKASGE